MRHGYAVYSNVNVHNLKSIDFALITKIRPAPQRAEWSVVIDGRICDLALGHLPKEVKE